MFWIALCLAVPAVLRAEDDLLRHRIDATVQRWQIGPPSPVIDDATFLRRISIDLLGRIPTREEYLAFKADSSPQKREQLVDRLLADSEFIWHMVERLDVMWMERRADQTVTFQAWRDYLAGELARGTPLNLVARTILSADGADPKTRGAARFYLSRGAELNLLTRDIGRMFFGRDFQCAQCHDHPLVQDYYQSDYYGLAAYVTRTFVFADSKSKQKVLAERAEGEVSYQSVFTGERRVMAPRLPSASLCLDPELPDDERYQVAPAKNVRPIPTYSRRAALAQAATDGTNSAFNRNLANRLWMCMFGRGVVDPPDLHSLDALPSHPELLDALTLALVDSKFDLRFILREIALSETYQRAIDLPADLQPHVDEARTKHAEWEAEAQALAQARDELAEQVEALRERWDAAAEAWTGASDALAAARKELAAAEKAAAKPTQAWAAAQQSLQKLSQQRQAFVQAVSAVNAAAKLLPGDQDLARAAAVFEQRRQATDSAWKKASEQEAAARATAERARQRVAGATAKVDQARKAEREAAQNVAAIDKRLVDLSSRMRKAAEQAYAAQVRARQARHLVELGRFDSEYRSQATKLANWKRQLQSAQATVVATSQRAELLKSQLTELNSTMAAKTPEVDRLRAEHAKGKQRVEALRKALEAAQAAEGVTKDDADVAQVVGLLKKKAEAAGKRHDELARQVQQATETVAELERKIAEIRKLLAGVEQERTAAAKIVDEATAATAQLTALLQPLAEKRSQSYELVRADAKSSLLSGCLRPLTAEQLAWSIMSATGVLEEQRRTALAALEKKSPLSDTAQSDPQARAAREAEVEAAARKSLQGNVNAFVSVFASGPGQPQDEFFATADQALFLTNGALVRSWLTPSPQRLVGKLQAIADPDQLAQVLYQTVMSREPTSQEKADVAKYLEQRQADRAQAIAEIVSALLASAEFRFNH